MDTELIRRWNERVKPEDEVIFLGDFCFKNTAGGKEGEGSLNKAQYYIEQLNGHITFVKGNHDHTNSLNTKIKSLVMEFGGLEVYCTHDPNDSNNAFKLNLVGHVHGLWKIKKDTKYGYSTILLNVGVDVNNFYPVSLNEVLETYNNYIKSKGGLDDKDIQLPQL